MKVNGDEQEVDDNGTSLGSSKLPTDQPSSNTNHHKGQTRTIQTEILDKILLMEMVQVERESMVAILVIETRVITLEMEATVVMVLQEINQPIIL